MTTSENEPAKLLLPYLQRADELQKHEPLVAYYCRLYAMERGLKIPPKERTQTTNALLVSLMKQLEKDKKSLQLGPDDYLHAEGFALNVFGKADKQDRAGRADLNTAKTFYAASIFFEILNQFGEMQPDLEQKQKYAAWKAADISKALKEGRKPLPGPPGGDNDLTLPSRTSSDEYDVNPTRNDFTTGPDPSRIDHSTAITPDSDSAPQPYDKVNFQHSTNISHQPSNSTPPPNTSTLHHYPTEDYPSDNFHHPPPSDGSEHSTHPQSHHHQPYQPEHQQPNHSQKNAPPSFSYPNFQSYPSYYQHSDASYSNLPPPNIATYHSNAQYDSIARNGSSVPEASPAKYECDSGNYEPPPEQITEAQKAARFAVKAFDDGDIYVAFDYLKKSLELLIKPSADH